MDSRQSRRLLQDVEGNFLTQLSSEATRGGTPLNLMNLQGLVGGVVVGGYLGHSKHKTMAFSILGEGRKGVNKTFFQETTAASSAMA